VLVFFHPKELLISLVVFNAIFLIIKIKIMSHDKKINNIIGIIEDLLFLGFLSSKIYECKIG